VGSEILQELFAQCAGPKPTEQTAGAFWKGMRRLSIDGTVDSVADTADNREAFRSSLDDELSHSPFPQARLVLLIECGTHLICDAELSCCRQAEAHGARLLLERVPDGAKPDPVGQRVSLQCRHLSTASWWRACAGTLEKPCPAQAIELFFSMAPP
jgi:hypothetical protein